MVPNSVARSRVASAGTPTREESSLMVIDGQSSGLLEDPQDVLGLSDSSSRALEENQSIVRVLEDRTGGTRDQWMLNVLSKIRMVKQSAEKVSNNDE